MDQAKADTMTLQNPIGQTSKGRGAPPAPGFADHPMIDMPFHVEIDGRQYRGQGISVVRAAISGLVDPQAAGGERLALVVFGFQGFTVALTVEMRLTSVDHQRGEAVLVFLDPTGEHLPQLRHLMNAYIAGDLVTLGNTLSVGASTQTAPVRAARRAGPRQQVQRLLGTVALGGLSLALVTLVATRIYQRAYTMALPTPAVVTIDGRTLAATATGQIDYLNPAAKSGEVAFTIRANTGQTLSVAMPCDCVAAVNGLDAGSTIFAGDPVMHLSQPGAGLILTGYVAADRALDLGGADKLMLRFADGTTRPAHLAPPGIQAGDADVLPYRLVPDQPLPETYSGQMAQVTLYRPVPALLSPLASVSSVFTQAIEAVFP